MLQRCPLRSQDYSFSSTTSQSSVLVRVEHYLTGMTQMAGMI